MQGLSAPHSGDVVVVGKKEADAGALSLPGLDTNADVQLIAQPFAEVEPCVEEMARRLNIQDILHKYPYQVSGGQRQRCACARALIHGPRLLLADEPTGALDSHSAQMLLNTFEGIHTGLGATILMVTHDAFTASYAGRILFLRDGEIFTELRRGSDTRGAFFEKILHVLTMMGGGSHDVR